MIYDTVYNMDFYESWLLGNNQSNTIRDGLYYILGVQKDDILEGFSLCIIGLETYVWGLRRSASYNTEAKKRFLEIFDVNNIESLTAEYPKIKSPKAFTLWMYQYISSFPSSLVEAYHQVTSETLYLEDNSPIKIEYKEYAKFDKWTLHQACCLISHTHPEFNLYPTKTSYLIPNELRYRYHLDLTEASIASKSLQSHSLNGQIYVQPLEYLKWAKTKNIEFHPILEKLVEEHSSDELTVSTNSKIKNNTLDKLVVQAVSKTLWSEHPDMTIEDMINHHAIQEIAGGKNYKGKHTLRGWIKEVDPRSPEKRIGRPKNKTLNIKE